MKSWIITGALLLTATVAMAQKKDLSLEKLLNFCLLPEAALPQALAQTGFQPAESDTTLLFEKRAKGRGLEKSIRLQQHPDKTTLQFSTLRSAEFFNIAQDLKRKGFFFAATQTVVPGVHALYQKGPCSVSPGVVQQGDTTWHHLQLELKKLPAASSIQYIEDLLQLPSHENLVAVFGPAQVRRDVFYFSEKELSKCSVLFPNTARQVIVVWKDEVNNRDVSLLVMGGETHRSAINTALAQQAAQNRWMSKQGVYVGMTLRQLQEANGGPLEFYGWESDEPGVVALHNKGNINFKTLGVQLHCLDCNEDRYYSDKPLLNSTPLVNQLRRVYVSTMVLKVK